MRRHRISGDRRSAEIVSRRHRPIQRLPTTLREKVSRITVTNPAFSRM